jgi:predicted permease
VAGAGLLARSFWNLQSVDPGFRPDHVLVSDASFPSAEMPEVVARYRELLGRIRAIPGVAAAGTTSNLPVAGLFHPDGHFYIEGRREQTRAADAGFSMVSPGYLSALRIPLLRGRDFTEADTESSQGVIIISQELARFYFPGADPIGQRIWFDSFEPKEQWLTVVGIAADVRQDSLTQKSQYAQAYVCHTQQQIAGLLAEGTLVVRTNVDPASLAGAVRNTIRAVNPESAPTPRTMESALATSLARQRFQTQILGAFAVLALLLAAVGLYGVLSYMVTANRAPIAIRFALGAPPSLVFRMITARALELAAAGALLGILGCLAVRRVLVALLFGIGPTDPMAIAVAVAVLLAVTVAAAFFPARRARRTDPMVALREE